MKSDAYEAYFHGTLSKSMDNGMDTAMYSLKTRLF